MKIRNIAAIGLIAGATMVGGTSAPNALTSDDPETQAYYDQVEQDWGKYDNDYFPGGYLPPNSF